MLWRITLMGSRQSKNTKQSLNQSKYEFLNIWPNCSEYLFYVDKLADQYPKLGLGTSSSVMSIGTCFAEQIHYYLKDLHVNYEPTSTNAFEFASDYGRITSIHQLHQLIRMYYTQEFTLAKYCRTSFQAKVWDLLPSIFRNCIDAPLEREEFYIDTSREHLFCGFSHDKLSEMVEGHIRLSIEAISKSTHIFIVLGQLSHYYDCNQNPFPVKPGQPFCEAQGIRLVSYNHNDYKHLRYLLADTISMIKSLNSSARIIFLESPVPLYANFSRSQCDFFREHWRVKSLIYLLLSDIIDTDKTLFYIPAYEIIMSANRTSLREDLRHVKQSFSNRIFKAFLE
jgi:hypothetical protein